MLEEARDGELFWWWWRGQEQSEDLTSLVTWGKEGERVEASDEVMMENAKGGTVFL